MFGHRSMHLGAISFNCQPFEIVDNFKYLGVLLPKSSSFAQTKEDAGQDRKALFGLYRKIRNLNLPIDCQLKLFDSTFIILILTYECEIWGIADISVIE